MAYMRKEWKDGDIITPESLNNMEEGISASQKEHAKTVDLPPGTYGGLDTSNSTYKIPNITVDANGRVSDVSNSVLPAATSGRVGLVTPNLYKSFKLQTSKDTTAIMRSYVSDGEDNYSYKGFFSIPDGIAYDTSCGVPKVENMQVIVPHEEAKSPGYCKIKANIAFWVGYDSKGNAYIFYEILNKSEVEAFIEKVHPQNKEHYITYTLEMEYWCSNPDENTMTM